MASLCYNFIYLKAWKLTTFTWFSTLCNLYLYFLCIRKIFCCYAETSAGNLLSLTVKAYSVKRRVETIFVFTTFSGVASCTKLIHCQCKCLMSLFRQSSETHCSCYEMLYNLLNRFNFLYWNRTTLEIKEIAYKNRLFLFISKSCIFFECIIVSCSGSQLQSGNSLRIPCMLYSILAPMELSKSRKRSFCLFLASLNTVIVHCNSIFCYSFKSDTSNCTCLCSEICIEQVL